MPAAVANSASITETAKTCYDQYTVPSWAVCMDTRRHSEQPSCPTAHRIECCFSSRVIEDPATAPPAGAARSPQIGSNNSHCTELAIDRLNVAAVHYGTNSMDMIHSLAGLINPTLWPAQVRWLPHEVSKLFYSSNALRYYWAGTEHV